MGLKTGQAARLKTLAGITAFVLLCIMGLQLYWLATSYKEQKSRFTADVENALVTALIKDQLNVSMPALPKEYSDPEMAEKIKDLVSSVVSQMPRDMMKKKRGGDTIQINTINEPMIAIAPTYISPDGKQAFIDSLMKLRDSMQVINVDLNEDLKNIKIDLSTLKKTLKAELEKRSINTPFEIATLNSQGEILQATNTPQEFKNITLKSEPNDLWAAKSPGSPSVQLAFPEANLFLLRRMSWIISASALLIIIACISFSYLLLQFFRQKRLADIRNDFMNNMTHELKTPISSVSIALEMLEDRSHPLTEQTRQEYVEIAHNELKRLTMLVDKVLKIAAFEKGDITITKEHFDAAPWLQSCVNNMRPLTDAGGATITYEVSDANALFYADKTHLTNLLQNLVENALKYNDKPQPFIKISIREEGNMSILEVEDNGKGIPATYTSKVFDKFFRVPSGDRHDTQGYGLGLSYVKGIAELHGGSAQVVSTEGKGSIFTISLPKEA